MARQYRIVALLILCISVNCFGKNIFSIELNDVDFGKLQYAVLKKNKKWIVVKNTSLFDQSKSLGQFEITNPKSIADHLNKLGHLEEALEKVSLQLGDIKETDNGFKHQRFYKLGRYKINPNDSYFKDISIQFEAIHKLIKLKPIKAAVLSNKNESITLSIFSQGTKIKGTSLKSANVCKVRGNTTICDIDQYGTLFF
jgi:hypothetical protein